MAKYRSEDGEFGIVEDGSVLLTLMEEPYPESDVDNPEGYYTAAAVDPEGNRYEIRWETTPAWNAAFQRGDDDYLSCNEDNACDWENCTVQ